MSAFHQGSSSMLRAKQLYKKRKSRFSYSEIKVLLEEVHRNRHIVVGQESTASPYELQYDIQTIDDEDVKSIDSAGEEIRAGVSRTSLPSSSAPPAEEGTPLLGGSHRRGAPRPSLAPRGGVSMREEIVLNAAQSVQEQRASNELLRSVSRSMELLSESLQQAVETQQDFVRDSLALQRESLQVLRDFASAALTTLQEKLNGHPAPRR